MAREGVFEPQGDATPDFLAIMAKHNVKHAVFIGWRDDDEGPKIIEEVHGKPGVIIALLIESLRALYVYGVGRGELDDA